MWVLNDKKTNKNPRYAENGAIFIILMELYFTPNKGMTNCIKKIDKANAKKKCPNSTIT